MKNIILGTFVIALMSKSAMARQGQGEGQNDDGSNISCTDLTTNSVILTFSSTQGSAQASTADYDLTVKARFTDVGEISITDRQSKDAVKVKSLEELLKVTLTADEDANPTIIEVGTHQGSGQLKATSQVSQDTVSVLSQSRRGVSQLEVTLTTDELPLKPIHILCQKVR